MNVLLKAALFDLRVSKTSFVGILMFGHSLAFLTLITPSWRHWQDSNPLFDPFFQAFGVCKQRPFAETRTREKKSSRVEYLRVFRGAWYHIPQFSDLDIYIYLLYVAVEDTFWLGSVNPWVQWKNKNGIWQLMPSTAAHVGKPCQLPVCDAHTCLQWSAVCQIAVITSLCFATRPYS